MIHGFTTRELGDDKVRIAEELEILPEQIVTVKQIHSNQVLIVGARHAVPLQINEADSLITQQPNIFLGIRTADCVPLLIYDPQQKICAAIHAGWRGLVGGVIENTVAEMKKTHHSQSDSLFVVIGPALCEKCFEVGPEIVGEFHKKFGSAFKPKEGKRDRSHIDLRKLCVTVLVSLGVLPESIELITGCTFCHNDRLYSYRKGDKEGRQLALIGIKV